jgi:transcriptional regulator with XRE-family HTH domain
VDKSKDLRKILSQNIRAAREALHITQAKLAEYADISLPYMSDIEYCKTWVSDKTLISLAGALNMEVYQLLIPPEDMVSRKDGDQTRILRQIAALIEKNKKILKKNADDTMNDLINQIIRLYSEFH